MEKSQVAPRFMHKPKDVDEIRGHLRYSHIHRPIYNYIFL